jgi:CheY-like chemotaxis protein
MAQPRTGTILIVDDDPHVTHSFARMLGLEGYTILTALDAETALQTVDTSHPDAILVDLTMPLVDGLAFLRRLRARKDQAETPVAIITGAFFVDDSVALELRDLGAAVYFKPLWLADLVAITQRLLGPSPDRAAAMRRLKLLLVDDCVAERDLYEMLLQTEFTILTASRGDEGVNVATSAHPDAIILDVSMPGLSGWEACARLKSDPDTEAIPVILLTGVDDQDLSQHAMAVGASALLRKPCPPDKLRGAIRAATHTNA